MIFDSPALQRRLFLKLLGGSFSAAATLTSTSAFAADKKRLVVFHKVQGHEFHAMQISPGKHSLRVQVTPGANISERSATIDGEFASGTEKMLRVLFTKSGEMKLSLQ